MKIEWEVWMGSLLILQLVELYNMADHHLYTSVGRVEISPNQQELMLKSKLQNNIRIVNTVVYHTVLVSD